ncbi:endospore germination permease [Ammoniphilus sp. YIM 78166]|uniref:GerAB/ArcD/ProY family transporter n=1 Tax=Ammoniphilus sp. YIM 78166 TaxID=1644106 RepID=UPI00107007E4|nr:endospore germination permease [Ammoniphilus sp. YIM 78166]
MEKIKISTVQALMLGVASVTIMGHLLFIPVLLNHAGKDSWLSLFLTLVPALMIGYVVARLAQLFPGRTLIEYSEDILGKWLGKIIALLFVFYFFHDASLALRGFGEFYTSAITPRTPIVVYFSAIVFMAVYAVRSGLEVLARTNQIFLITMIPVGIMASIMTQKDKDYANFLPILEYGPEPMLMGTFSLVSLYSTFIVLGMIFPYISNTKKLKRFSMLTMVILILMFIGPVTGPIALFGPERSIGLTFPSFQILRDMQVGELQRLDLLGILLWSMGSFSKITLFLYATTLGLAQCLRLSDYRVLSVPIGVLMIVTALLNSESFVEIFRFFKDTYPYYSFTIAFLIPMILLVTARLRFGSGGHPGGNRHV